MEKKSGSGIFLASCILLTAAIFVADIALPMGIAGGFPYIVVILLTPWLPSRKHTIAFGIVTTILTLLDYLFSLHGLVPLYMVHINRVYTLLGIWLTVYFVNRFRASRNELKKSTGIQRAMFEYATEGIIVSNYEGKIIAANPETEKMFGYSPRELINGSIEMLVPVRFAGKHVDHRKNFNKSPHPRSMGQGMDLYARRKDGTEFPVEISLSPFENEDGRFIMAFIINITERKKNEEALKRAHFELQHFTRELEASNHDLEQFAYVASHDLQEPLRKIQSFGERLAARELANLSEQGKDYVERMQNAAQRMQVLINDLLTFSRISTRAQPFTGVDLNKVVREVVSDIEVTIEKRNAKMEIGELPVIEGEPTQMRQLFQNLLVNACKFTREDVPPVVKVYSREGKGGMADVYVEDNGIGFDEKYLDRIFNIFQRLEGTRYEGSGIGLAVCKKIVSRHGGTITAMSKPGEGATFIISLPRKQSAGNREKTVPF